MVIAIDSLRTDVFVMELLFWAGRFGDLEQLSYGGVAQHSRYDSWLDPVLLGLIVSCSVVTVAVCEADALQSMMIYCLF